MNFTTEKQEATTLGTRQEAITMKKQQNQQFVPLHMTDAVRKPQQCPWGALIKNESPASHGEEGTRLPWAEGGHSTKWSSAAPPNLHSGEEEDCSRLKEPNDVGTQRFWIGTWAR